MNSSLQTSRFTRPAKPVPQTAMVLAAGLGFTPLFIFAAASYLLALGWLHLLLPNIRRAEAEPALV